MKQKKPPKQVTCTRCGDHKAPRWAQLGGRLVRACRSCGARIK